MNDRRDEISQLLSETRDLLGGVELPADDAFSLEDILAEFSQSGAEPAPKPEVKKEEPPTEQVQPAVEEPTEEELPVCEDVPQEAPETAPAPEPAPEEQKVSLEDLMARTVDSVLEENEEAALPPKRSLKAQWIAATAGVKTRAAAVSEAVSARFDKHSHPAAAKAVPQEPAMEQAFREETRRRKRLTRQLTMSAVPVAALLLASVAHTWFGQYLPQLWHAQPLLRCGVMGGGLLLTLLLTPAVWKEAVAAAKKKQTACELAALLTSLAVLGDCILGAVAQNAPRLPLAGCAALMVWLCVAGQRYASVSRREGFRLADLGGRPPYVAEVTEAGVSKRKGRLDGFYTASHQLSPADRIRNLLLPLLLSAATVLTGVVCIGGERMEEFLYVWSALLCACVPLGLPLCGTLPLRHLNRRLGRSGCSVAGYAGAAAISTSRQVVVSDADLFPPGTVSLNGLKLYGAEIGTVISYAATVCKAAGSHLLPLFDQLLSSEGGTYRKLEDLEFYEEGGFGGTIRGETVMMGSAYFMKCRRVDLPRDLKTKSGLFMAVDGQLAAIFAIKYAPSRNVEWALRALRRSRIEPVLAVRSGNITPGVLKNKFGFDAKPIYPDVYTRVELSEEMKQPAERADAIIYREGLMPFAETLIGSRRCVRMVKNAAALCWLGSLCGLLLGYYLSSVSAYNALNAGYLLIFALLWLLPTVLLSDLTRRY